LFIHVAVPPTASTIGFGEYAVVVNELAPLTMDTGVPELFDGIVGEEDELQAAETMSAPHVMISRIFMMSPRVP
jgi:hypothetical protein